MTKDERDEIVRLLICTRGELIEAGMTHASNDLEHALALLTNEPGLLRIVAQAACQAAEWGDGPCNPNELESELCIVCRIRRAAEEMP